MSDAASLSPRVTSRFNQNSTAMEVIAGVDLTGKTAIVTGGASGIGIETARALASAGAHVTIAVRNLDAGKEVADAINAEYGAGKVTVEKLELGSLASVRDFAKRWGDKPVNLLINNAGIMACPEGKTDDGFETQFGVNHLGHFLLTVLLTPNLEKGAPSRVVSLSSAAHMAGKVDLDDPNFERRPYHAFTAYGQAKSANALFAVEYDRRYKNKGIRAFSVMPGVIRTNLGRHMTREIAAEIGLVKKEGEESPFKNMHVKTPPQGAATSIWAAVGHELEGKGGLYLEDTNEAIPATKDTPRGQGVARHAQDPETAKGQWTLSEKLVGL